MRRAVYVICALYALIWGIAILQVFTSPQDNPIGDSIVQGIIQLGVLLTLVCTIPAAALARLGRALPVALGLALFPAVALIAAAAVNFLGH